MTRLRQELKEEKDQAATQRIHYTGWNKELQDRITALRAEKKTWTNEAAAMRAAEKEARVRVDRIALLLSSPTPHCLVHRTRSLHKGSCWRKPPKLSSDSRRASRRTRPRWTGCTTMRCRSTSS